jgi:hypothetical protein
MFSFRFFLFQILIHTTVFKMAAKELKCVARGVWVPALPWTSAEVTAAVDAANTVLQHVRDTWTDAEAAQRVYSDCLTLRVHTFVVWARGTGDARASRPARFAVNVLPTSFFDAGGAAPPLSVLVDMYDREQPGFVWTVHGSVAWTLFQGGGRTVQYRIQYFKSAP